MRSVSVRKLPSNKSRLYSTEHFQRRPSLRRRVRNAVESNKSLLVVSSICFLGGTLLLISSMFTNNDRKTSESNPENSINNPDLNDEDSSSSSNGNQYQSGERTNSMTLFGFTFIGIGFSVLCLSVFLIVCCHVNKWLAIERRPSSSKFRSDSATSLISRRKTSIEDLLKGTKISPEPSAVTSNVVPGKLHIHHSQELNPNKVVKKIHEPQNITLVDIEAVEEENTCNKSEDRKLSVLSTIKSSNDHPTPQLKAGKSKIKQENIKRKGNGTKEQKRQIRKQGWIT